MVFVFQVSSAEVASVVGGVRVYPGYEFYEFRAGEFYAFVALADEIDEFAFVGAE
ncbi:MAG: hypothetical protein ACYSWZ_11200 [Planctomycetota bacterium]